MSDDRWPRVKALFQDALERPPAERAAFVASAAGDDVELRVEVESLLEADAAGEPSFDRLHLPGVLPVLSALARGSMTAGASTPALQPGQRVGPYEIGPLVGAGAMGEVYRARDTKLDRDVAIKVLPPVLALDANRLARFRREAQVLAALKHPNIAAIHGFEESGGLHALVLELVDGPTLADRIAGGHLPFDEALAIGRQVADALEAAHDKGIVHRDLKPANIKIDGTGAAKVLDFGLAKPAAESSGPALTASHDGLILGTASYMSPEQARGHRVDKRTDIWAFGCVLYEMLSGRLVFPGATVSDTIAKILEREPDWTALPDDTPAPIRRLLLRCLTKDPRARLRDIGDARLEIDAAADLLTVTQEAADAGMPARRQPWWLPWAAVVALAAAVGVVEFRRGPAPFENPLAGATFEPFTSWEGSEEGAEISPNGELVAFLSDRDGEFDLWVSQVGTGLFHNLTREFPRLAAAGTIVRKLGFNADSSRIWFNPGDGDPPMIMPWTGGTPQPLLEPGTNTPAWSPDGTRLVFVDKANRDDPIYVADPSGGDRHPILGPGPLKNLNPVWSLDSQWIYFTRGTEPQDETAMDVWRLRASGGPPERVTTGHLPINFLAPLDRRRLLFVARAEDRSGPWLWWLDVESGSSGRVPTGVDQYASVSASRDGRRIVATVTSPGASLWRVPFLERMAEEADAAPYTLPVPTGYALAPRFGGGALFYLSERGTGDGLWKVQDGRASQVRRGVDGAIAEPPAVSREGRLAIVLRKEGRRRLVVMSADGTNAQTLAPSIEIAGAAGQGVADWSPDGAHIVAGGSDDRGPALFIIPVTGGAPVRLLDGNWVNPIWSPRGDLIVYAGRSVIGQVELRGVRPDGTPVELPKVLVRPGGYRFLPDGSGLVYVERIQALDFWRLDLATGARRSLTRLANRGALRTFDVTPDGSSIVFDRSRQNSNIVLIERPQ